jgi:hypothetical protein
MTRSKQDSTVLIAKAIVWVAGKAIEYVPIVGPVFKIVNFLNDVAEIRQAYSKRDP